MALVDARIRRTAKVTETRDSKGITQLTGSAEFLVISDTPNPSFQAVLANTTSWPKLDGRLPKVGDVAIIGDKSLVCSSREVSYADKSDRVVLLSVRYSGKETEDKPPPNDTEADTWQRITIQSQQVTEPAKGWDTLNATVGKPQIGGGQKTAQNSAGDPVDGLEEDTALVRLVYTNTQVRQPNFQKLQEYTNTCNDRPFLGGIEYTVRCIGWNGEYDQKNQVWSITVEFLYKPNDWSIEFFDVGFNELVNGKRQAILDAVGNPVSSPVPLDGNGQAAPLTGSNNDEPPDLSIRYLFPYPSRDLRQIWADCRIN